MTALFVLLAVVAAWLLVSIVRHLVLVRRHRRGVAELAAPSSVGPGQGRRQVNAGDGYGQGVVAIPTRRCITCGCNAPHWVSERKPGQDLVDRDECEGCDRCDRFQPFRGWM